MRLALLAIIALLAVLASRRKPPTIALAIAIPDDEPDWLSEFRPRIGALDCN